MYAEFCTVSLGIPSESALSICGYVVQYGVVLQVVVGSIAQSLQGGDDETRSEMQRESFWRCDLHVMGY